jgi:WD40 repeat protein
LNTFSVQRPSSVAFIDSGESLAVGTRFWGDEALLGYLQIWDPLTGVMEGEIRQNAGRGGICSLEVSPDGLILAAGYCTYTYNISTWEAESDHAPISDLTGLDEPPFCGHGCEPDRNIIALSEDGRTIASGTYWDRVPVRDMFTRRLRLVLYTSPRDAPSWRGPAPVNGLAFSGDGSFLAIAAGSELQVFSLSDGSLLWQNQEPAEAVVSGIAISPDSRLLILVDSVGHIEFWGIPQR